MKTQTQPKTICITQTRIPFEKDIELNEYLTTRDRFLKRMKDVAMDSGIFDLMTLLGVGGCVMGMGFVAVSGVYSPSYALLGIIPAVIGIGLVATAFPMCQRKIDEYDRLKEEAIRRRFK